MKMDFPQQGVGCKVINDADKPAINAEINLTLTFKDVIPVVRPKGGIQKQSGAVILQRPWTLYFPRIEPGKDNAFEFFLDTSANVFILIGIRDNATSEYVGKTGREIVPLSHPYRVLSINPFVLKQQVQPSAP